MSEHTVIRDNRIAPHATSRRRCTDQSCNTRSLSEGKHIISHSIKTERTWMQSRCRRYRRSAVWAAAVLFSGILSLRYVAAYTCENPFLCTSSLFRLLSLYSSACALSQGARIPCISPRETAPECVKHVHVSVCPLHVCACLYHGAFKAVGSTSSCDVCVCVYKVQRLVF